MKEFIKAYTISFFILNIFNTMHKISYDELVFLNWYCVPVIISTITLTFMILNKIEDK